MKIIQFHLGKSASTSMAERRAAAIALEPHLVLAFGAVADLEAPELLPALRAAFPQAHLAGCSTAGQISAEGVTDGTVAVTAIRFAHPAFRMADAALSGAADSRAAGEALGRHLAAPDLHDVVVFGQGVGINGSALLDGISAIVGPGVKVSGGLAGDGADFRRTVVLFDGGVSDRHVVGIGFYGERLSIGHGSVGGWQPFGPARRVTRAEGNILYELDGSPALEVYKRYLGDYARDLPSSGLLFPFSMLGADHSAVGLIRTILGVNERDGSLTLAGDVVNDGYLQLMHASSDALIDGAEAAAELARGDDGGAGDTLSLLVSCVGRRLVLGDRIDEEVEAVADAYRGTDVVAGFYSYGEISPFLAGPECKLHNQTMTISRWREAA
jgi:hypothetical protein